VVDLYASAYHQAGHAVFAFRYGIGIKEPGILVNHRTGDGICNFETSIQEGDGQRLASLNRPDLLASFRKRAERDIDVCLAGPLAEKRIRLLLKAHSLPFCPQDVQTARQILREAFPARPGHEVLLQIAIHRMYRLFRNRKTWGAVETLAAQVTERGHLSPKETAEILHRCRLPYSIP